MTDALRQTAYIWHFITYLGSASLLLPTLVIAVTSLWLSQQWAAIRIWLISLTFAIIVTLISKIIFLGWGIGIGYLDFTGISGHALLATSVLPVLFSWFLAQEQNRFRLISASLGLLLGAGVGMSRIVLGVHSTSEVVAGWLIGLVVSGVTLNALKGPNQRPWFFRTAALILLFALGSTTSNYLPTHDWEVRLALLLSGHGRPYARLPHTA